MGGKHLIPISLLTDGLLKYKETFDDFRHKDEKGRLKKTKEKFLNFQCK